MAVGPVRVNVTGMSRIVLLGAGHAHLHVIANAAELVRRGATVVVVAPGDFWYSGLATGVLAGQYEPALDVVDIGALVARAGGRFVRDAAVAVDRAARHVVLASGDTLGYDLLSLDVGSEVAVDALPGAARCAVPVKPLSNLLRLRRDLEARWRGRERVRVVVVGGGSSGVEVAAAVEQLAVRRSGTVEVTLLADTDRLLPGIRPATAVRVARELRRRGVRCATGTRATSIEPDRVRTATGGEYPFDLLALATGLAPAPLLRRSGLRTDAAGALLVDATLRSVADPEVLGAGDCIAFDGRALPHIGVHAVKQAPVLLHNLLAVLDGRPPRRYRPQRRALLILNLGDGTGLATWGGLAWRGRAAFWLKDRIDRRWLARVRLDSDSGT
jgi:NADH dehydrogenase FAD-containing subunit